MDWSSIRQQLPADPVVAYACAIAALCLLILLGPTQNYGRDPEPVDFDVPIPEELRPGFQGHLVDGALTSNQPQVRNGKIFPHCPADGRNLTRQPITPASRDDIDQSISRAAVAQVQWARTSFSQRRQVLSTILKYILSHQDEIVTACALDSGKTKIDACFGEILVTAEKLQWTIKHGEKALLPSQRPTNLLMCYKRNTVVYEPLGVVAACFSWNYPFHFVISNVTSALFAGNSIILKPSEQTCWSSNYFQSIVRGALKTCGHNQDLVQTTICLPDAAEYLTSHPELSHITFIGSKEVAYKVTASAAKSLTPVCVELGGKDPCIVLDDKKTRKSLSDTAAIVMRGTFQSAGQNCIGIERVIALPGIHDKLLDYILPLAKQMRLGSITLDATPPDMGSMISAASFDRLESLVADAVKAGAKLHHGGVRYRHPSHPDGHYFTPTVLSSVTPDMAITQTELFAPVLLMMRAETIDHAISLANSTTYALGASVFGDPKLPATQRAVRKLRAGMVSVNDFGTYYACGMPFGGAKGSGYGRFSGAEGLQSLCNLKSICADATWAEMLGIRTRIPPVLQYPVKGRAGWEACKGVVETGYSPGWLGMLGGVRQLLRGLSMKESLTVRDGKVVKGE